MKQTVTLFEGLEDQKIFAEKFLSVSRESLHIGQELKQNIAAVPT